MSGHSKWATTKYRKGAQDSARAKVFAKIIRQVEVAAREGGSDMSANAGLRTMYAKARDSSVPIDTISTSAGRENNRRVTRILKQCARDGVLEPGDFVYESAALFGLCRSAMLERLMRGSDGPVVEQADKVLRFFLHGAKGKI